MGISIHVDMTDKQKKTSISVLSSHLLLLLAANHYSCNPHFILLEFNYDKTFECLLSIQCVNM